MNDFLPRQIDPDEHRLNQSDDTKQSDVSPAESQFSHDDPFL